MHSPIMKLLGMIAISYLTVETGAACSCRGQSVQEAFSSSEIVFEGEIASIDGPITYGWPAGKVKFKVSKSLWKGDVPSDLEMPAVAQSSACLGFDSRQLKAGNQLLVYAWPISWTPTGERGYFTGACARTGLLKDAKDDVTALSNIVRQRESVRAFLQKFDSDLKDRFVSVFADLNDDGTPEAIVYLTSNDWCGSGGCTMLILARDADTWRLLTKVAVTRPPIRVLARRSNGWRSLVVWVQGGGVQPGYEAELRFDGKTYPTNPSTSPNRRSYGIAEVETLIPSSVGW